MELRLEVSMSDIFIFDIDGCIMPNVFPIIKEAKNENDAKNQEILKNASKLSLFPEFVEFYKRNCAKSLAVYFITGRKKKYYGKITGSQLKPLKNYKNYIIKYFPDNKPHLLKEYFHWKAKTIKKIMNQWPHDSIRYHIYDDLEELFPLIFKEILSIVREYNCNLIQEKEDWNQIMNMET